MLESVTREEFDAGMAAVRAALGEEAWAAAYAAGHALSLEEVIAEAFESDASC